MSRTKKPSKLSARRARIPGSDSQFKRGGNCVEVESLLSSGSDDTSDCFVSLAFDAIDMTAFLAELLK
jgi:hypothetical protein